MCNTCGCSAAEEINPVESVVVPAPLGRGVAQFYSEGGDMATYAPSEEAEGSTPATEPTNANFSAESKSMFGKDKNGRMYARRRNGRIITHNAETPKNLLTHCADCKCKLNSKNHKMDTSGSAGGVGSSNGALCDSCFVHLRKTGNFNNPVSLTQYGAESKSMFGKDKNGRMYARQRNGRIITHNAEHEGLYACSKCNHWNRNPVDDITKCKKCGNETFTFVKRSEFMPEGDGNVVGQQTFGFNGTPLHAEEDTSFGLVGEGNDFGQMRAEDDDFYYCSKCDEGFSSINPTEEGQFCDSCLPSSATLHDEMERITMDADYALEKPFTTGAKLSAGLLTGAALFGVVGASLTALLGSMMGRGE